MIQAIQKIERSIKERRDTDKPLINWWLFILLVNEFTLGIYAIVLFFKRIGRINKFIIRKKTYYDSVIDYTEKYAQEKNKLEPIQNELKDLKDLVASNFPKNIKEIKAGLSFLFCIITVGIYYFFLLYKLNKVWYDLEIVEQEFDDKLSAIWMKLELMKYPFSFNIDSSKKRSFPLYLILSIVTVSIWFLVWDYKIHTDPDNLYREFHSIEDTVLQIVRQ